MSTKYWSKGMQYAVGFTNVEVKRQANTEAIDCYRSHLHGWLLEVQARAEWFIILYSVYPKEASSLLWESENHVTTVQEAKVSA